MVKKKPRITVIFDTSVLSPKAMGFIPNEIKNGIQDIERKDNLVAKFYIPDTVYEECLDDFCRELPNEIRGYIASYGNVKKIFKDKSFPQIKYKEKDLPELYRQMVEECKLEKLKTNWGEISLEKLMKRACRKEGVFKEEGFQDALIFENIKQYIKNSSVKDERVIILCADLGLGKAFKSEFPDTEVIGNWNEAEEYINTKWRIANSELEEEKVTELTNKANKLFKDELFEKYMVCKKINSGEFIEILKKPRESGLQRLTMIREELELIEDETKCKVLNTNFSRKYRGDTYSWETSILVTASYEVKSRTSPFEQIQENINIALEPFNEALTDLKEISYISYMGDKQVDTTPDPIKREEEKQRIKQFRFTVKWNSKFDKEGNIKEPKFLKIKFKNQYSPLHPFVLG